jgi:hypothetical protein
MPLNRNKDAPAVRVFIIVLRTNADVTEDARNRHPAMGA